MQVEPKTNEASATYKKYTATAVNVIAGAA